MTLEQLWYTWGERGLDGRGRFQVVAVSDALRADPVRMATAVQLCRYDPPAAGHRPDSFGWIDDGDWRYAFSRVDAGTDPMGRPGNFAAHVVVAPARTLTVSEVLASFGSAFWWRGQLGEVPPSMHLPDTAELPAGPRTDPAPPHLLVELLEVLLTVHPGPVRLRHEPTALVHAAQALQDRLPGIWDGLSFSTFESGDAAVWFDVHGSPGEPEAVQTPRTVRLAASFVVHGRPTQRGLRGALRSATRQGSVDRTRLGDLLAGLAGASGHMAPGDGSPPGAVTPDSLLLLLSDPDTAAAALDRLAARRAVATALVAGDRRVSRLLAALGEHLEPEQGGAIGAVVGDLVLSSPGSAGRAVAAVEALPNLLDAAAEVLAEADHTDHDVRQWPLPLIRAVLRHRRAHHPVADPVVVGAAPHAADLVHDPRIPLGSRAALVGVALAATASADLLVRACGEGDLLDAVITNTPAAVQEALLRMTTRDAVEVLGSVHDPGPAAAHYRRWVTWVVGSASPDHAVELLQHAITVDPDRTGGWDHAIDGAALSTMRWVCGDPRRPTMSVQLTRMLMSDPSRRGTRLGVICELVARPRPPSTKEMEDLVDAVAGLPAEDVPVAAGWVLDVLVARCTLAGQVHDVVRSLAGLAGLTDDSLEPALSTAALRAVQESGAPAGLAVLNAVHDLDRRAQQTGLLPRIRRRPSPRSPAFQRLQQAVGQTNPPARVRAGEVSPAPPPTTSASVQVRPTRRRPWPSTALAPPRERSSEVVTARPMSRLSGRPRRRSTTRRRSRDPAPWRR